MTDLTDEAVKALLEGTTPGPWKATSSDHPEQGVFGCEYRIAKMTGGEIKRDCANATLMTAAPDLARTVIALHAQLADAEARGMEMALKTYRTGAGVDNGNYPLWAYDADYETAVRKKAEVHRKAASDRATRKDI